MPTGSESPPQSGAKLLAAYLKDSGLTYEAFGELVECTKAHVCGLVTKKSSPSWDLARRIEAVTESHVPISSWAHVKSAKRKRRAS